MTSLAVWFVILEGPDYIGTTKNLVEGRSYMLCFDYFNSLTVKLLPSMTTIDSVPRTRTKPLPFVLLRTGLLC